MNIFIRKCLTTFSISTLILVIGATSSFAEDIEIYTGNATNANVLFILDQSESMLQLVGSTGKTRDQVAKEAFQAVMSQSYDNLNVGFMDYGRDNGAGVDLPVADINQPAKSVEPNVVSTTETYASMISRFANNLEGPQNNAKTALVEALLEAAKYYRGDVIDNLSQGIGSQGTWNDSQSRYTGGSWRAAGPRTLTTGGTSAVAGGYCKQAGSPAGAPYNVCNNIWPNSCSNRSASSGSSNVCTGGKSCTEFDITGTECVTETCNGYTNVPWSRPAYTRCRETGSTTAKQYISPIQSSCDRNFIVLLSDGGPTILGSHEQTSIQGFVSNSLTPPPSSPPPCEDLSQPAAGGFTDSSILSKGVCGADLVKAINTSDVVPSIPGSTITTHTIGFQLGGAPQAEMYLQKLATDGGGQFFDANSSDPTQLVTIIQSLLSGLSTKARSISTPITTINLGNPLTTRDEVYYTQFTPTNSPRWKGNVKGYFIGPRTVSPADPTIAIRDLNQDIATDANGDFVAGARSFWTSGSDGSDVSLGGFAALLAPGSRTLYTDDGATGGGGPSFVDLRVSTFDETDLPLFNLTSSGNATADHAMVDQLVDWARGVDVDDENNNGSSTDARAIAGDPLHTVPFVAQYATGPARVLYTMTNEGYIHAIDVSTNGTSGTGGDEIFAYMPSDLLKNLEPLRVNTENNPKIYGLDGPLTLHQPDGILDTAGNKYLYFGMRRGGKNYYSLDVSSTSSPSLRWVIKGGAGDFAELAQTWSKPTPAKIKLSASDPGTDVLVFGGGYDVAQDTPNTVRTADAEGRAVFIVDASDGSLLWSAGPDNSHDLNLGLQNSIPGGIAVVDLNADGVQDRLYFGDTGGRLWRVDLDTTLGNSTGYMLADLATAGATDPVHNRRFYTEPSVTRLVNGKLGITIGSGFRAKPLNNVVADRTYMIYDPNAALGDIPSTAPAAKIDGTGANAVQDVTSDFTFNPNAPSANVNGWKIEWPVGTKVMTDIDVVEGELRFSLYEPPTIASSCLGNTGRSNQLIIDVNGRPIGQPSSFYSTSGNTVFDSGTYIENILWGGSGVYVPNGMGMGYIDGSTPPSQPNTSDPLKTRFWLNLDTLTP